MATQVLVRYGEIALKGKNRGQFEQQLLHNLKAAVTDFDGKVVRMHGRFMVTGPGEHGDKMIERLSRVFGVVSVSPVSETGLDLEDIKAMAAEITGQFSPGQKTFKVEARRSNKNFPYTSPEISRALGSHLQQLFPDLVVDLKQPAFKLAVEIGFDRAYLYRERTAGPGGLPVGISGRSLLLLSGGIDSPVAGWLAMKRGLFTEALHFHSFPFTSRRSQEKAVDLCRKLAAYSNKIPLHMISMTAIQKELKASCPENLGIILLRRMMYRLAEMVSGRRNLQALVTGENLGQVASQTLESIDVISRSTGMLVLRPLLGFDKREIIGLAEKIDTYETSVLPYEDCCTVFLPGSPVTKPRLDVVEKYEGLLDMESLLGGAIESLETKIVGRV